MMPPSTQATLDALRRGDLAGTRELRLPGLAEFPAEIFGLADTLELLDLSGGRFDALPVGFEKLRRLRVLFCSGNPFEQLPSVLGEIPTLSQIGFRGCGLRHVPDEALPQALRWLTLTDNEIEHMPESLGRRPLLQKLMLSGNRLRELPRTMADAPNLELIRLSANRFEVLPPWLTALPRLAWLTFAGSPCDHALTAPEHISIPWDDLELGDRLGEGASGEVHRAFWKTRNTSVAVKLFKGAMTSDGLPACEMAGCLAAGRHPNLTSALGRIMDAPDDRQGLVMPLLPPDWRVLAGPPSLESCSRDVYDRAFLLSRETTLRIARSIAAATAHLHARGVLHGDLYAHNILWDGHRGEAVLSDFGAACGLPQGLESAKLQQIETRAFGLLLGELLDRCEGDMPALRAIEAACVTTTPAARPLMQEVVEMLSGIT